jgi:hypothetical protein
MEQSLTNLAKERRMKFYGSFLTLWPAADGIRLTGIIL